MSIGRPIFFWVALLAVVLAALVLLHGILLPFVAGMVLAYLLDRPVRQSLDAAHSWPLGQ